MQIFRICSVLCLLISNVIDVSEAECDEYFVVLEEHICSDGTRYRVTPLKKENINWDRVIYPCNSAVKNFREECLAEFNYNSTNANCIPSIKVVNNQKHYYNAGNHSEKLITIATEAPDVTTNNISDVKEKPNYRLDEEFTASMFDVNLIYINENNIRNGSGTTSKRTQNETLNCDYAEIVCFDESKLENKNLSDVQKDTYNTRIEELASTLLISFDRDATSSVQPIFTGYFPKSSNDRSTNYNGNFKDLKPMSTSCSIPKYNHCKKKIQINVYFKVNYIENNTITKYPNCTQNPINSRNVLNVKCEDVLFAKHNQHIPQTLPIGSPRQGMWICQIKELKYPKLSSKDQHRENINLHFVNCSNNNKIKSRDNSISPTSNSKNIIMNSTFTKGGNETIKTETPVGIDRDHSSQENLKNIVTIHITENTNNCSQKIPLNVDEGKIIDLGINRRENFPQNNNFELMFSNCINYNSSINNDKQPPSNTELTIILKSESLNASNLEHFNGPTQDKSEKQRILLKCNHHNQDSSSNATSNKTTLQCESIDLDFYNITGIYITPSSQTSQDKTTIISENKIKQKVLSWNCQILELNYTSKDRYKKNMYFKNCSNDIHINNNKSNPEDKKLKQMVNGENKYAKEEFNKTENPSGKFNLTKPPLPPKPKNIKISITEMPNNCSQYSSLIIDEGKIIDLGVNTNQVKILHDDIIDIKLSSCIDVNSSISNETHPNSNVDLTIIMKNESLDAANLQLFNGTAKNESFKQRILLRCEFLNPYSSSNATSDIHCESIDLDSNNITGIEISTKESQSTITNINKELKKDNGDMVEIIENSTKGNIQLDKNGKLSTNETVNNNSHNKGLENNRKIVENKETQKNISEPNGSQENNKTKDGETVNNNSHNKGLENNTKIVENKETQKNISETNGSQENNKTKEGNKEIQKTNSKKKEISTNLIFNRKKNIPNDAGQTSLGRGSLESEQPMLITLLAVVGASILMTLAWRLWPKKKEYDPAPTREQPDEEETPF